MRLNKITTKVSQFLFEHTSQDVVHECIPILSMLIDELYEKRFCQPKAVSLFCRPVHLPFVLHPLPPPSSVYSTRFTHFIAHIRYCIFHSQLPLCALCLSINTWVLPLTTRCAGRPILSIFVSALVQPHCRHLSSNCKYLFYRCYILPFSDYCDTAWYSALSVSALNKFEVHHRLLLKILHNKDRPVSSKSLYHIARTTPLITRHKSHLCSLIHKIYLQKTPSHMQMYNCFLPSGRTRNNLGLPPAST